MLSFFPRDVLDGTELSKFLKIFLPPILSYPKIHKAENLLRPIVSANGHPNTKISELVDLHLQPHVNSLFSYSKDTTD